MRSTGTSVKDLVAVRTNFKVWQWFNPKDLGTAELRPIEKTLGRVRL